MANRLLRRHAVRTLPGAAALVVVIALMPAAATAEEPDPRIGLAPGWLDAASAISNMEWLAHLDKPAGFVNPANPGDFAFVTSDLAFTGGHAFMGNFNGFNIIDIADPTNPEIVTSVICPGGQGDMSVYGDLLFMSVEESRGRLDCSTNPTGVRFQGVRVFDVSDVANPVQVAAVQTCRGSHTHSVVTDPDDPDHVYVYVSGTAGVRPASTLAGCNNNPADGENPSRWRIEVIKVPLADPAAAAVVNEVRLFTDPETGAINGLQNTLPTPQHPSGINWSPQPITDACHDITSYPAVGLAVGACEGNGILIDISDAANPVRLDAVADPNFAYWHSGTLSNDGTKVIFTDEWGGGTAARCRPTDQPQWGANAIFEIVDGKMEFRSYYKLPVPMTTQENCVAHNGSLIPVPGRDILAQAWYQGGISLMDFTDPSNPVEIGYFDRGPISGTSLVLGGFWSAYWYNGQIYGSEIARGLDVFGLAPSEHLTEAEIAAAREVQLAEFNAQHQPQITWAPSLAVYRAAFDQLLRTCTSTITGRRIGPLNATGVTCLVGATQIGPVQVAAGATVLVLDSTITGAVAATSAGSVQIYGSDVVGAVSLNGTTGRVAVVDSNVTGPVQIINGASPDIAPAIAGNTVVGPLSCSGNTAAPIDLGAPNEITGPISGQCLGMGI